MDVALKIDVLYPAAQYGGCTNLNTEEQWAAVRWEDGRGPKPTWAELQAAGEHPSVTKEAARQAARPKRSQINAAVGSAAAATSIASLRAAVLALAGVMDSVLVWQQVDVDEDI